MMPAWLRRGGLALLAALSFTLPAVAQPSVQEVVQRFDAAQAKVATLQAPFSLTIRRAMLKTPTVTRGTLYLQESDFAHFSFAPPEDLILHIKNANRKFLGLGQKLSYLSDYFQISLGDGREVPGTLLLTLQPRSLSVRKRMQVLLIWVDRESWLPRQMNWVERSGDSWLLELGALVVNQPLPASVTGFKLPPGIPVKEEFSFFATRKK